MGVLLGFFIVIKYVFSMIFVGPLNFGIELFFWIISGILFGPINGMLFSIICDTFITMTTTGIGFWMIEYAIIPPCVSLISWFYFKLYKDKNIWTIVVSVSVILIMIVIALVVFGWQLINNSFKYDGLKKINSYVSYALIIFFTFSILIFTITCLILFKIKNDWKYIRWIYYSSLIITIIIIFRWIWGPYAFSMYLKRFNQASIDFKKQYSLTLLGIVSKSYISIPLSILIMTPILNIVEKYQVRNLKYNRYF